MRETIYVIYPIRDSFKERFFDGRTKVFVKYLAHNSTKLGLKSKVVFYASRGSKKLVGEGDVQKVEFLSPTEVINRYREELFLTETEFLAYVRKFPQRSSSKEMLTLTLTRLRKYEEPIDYYKPITMAGQYITAREYSTLIRAKKGEKAAHP